MVIQGTLLLAFQAQSFLSETPLSETVRLSRPALTIRLDSDNCQAQPFPVRYCAKARKATSNRLNTSTPDWLLQEEEPPESAPTSCGSVALPIQSGAPDDPGSVTPDSQRTLRKLLQ